MINIHEELWVIKGHNKTVEDSSELLAYMTHKDLNKTGEETQAFQKRKDTGTHWADNACEYKWVDGERVETGDVFVPNTLEFSNTPTKGFKVIGSQSRWSTQNKVIRIEDPRGFVVEIPTDNLTTLLKHTTVKEGEVQEECVWGKSGNNHILLSTNSEIYKTSRLQNDQKATAISFTKLLPGQVVKFTADSSQEYIYMGRGKAIWEVQTRQALRRNKTYFGQSGWISSLEDDIVHSEEVKDTKLCFIFKNKVQNTDRWGPSNWEYKGSGKCIPTGAVEDISEVEPFDIYLPDRCKEETYTSSYNITEYGLYNTSVVVSIEMKK